MNMGQSYDEGRNEVDQIHSKTIQDSFKNRLISKIESRLNFYSTICKVILVLGNILSTHFTISSILQSTPSHP